MSVQTPFGLLSSFKSYKKDSFDNAIKVYGYQYIGYIEKKQVINNIQWINEHKVYLPSAIGSGDVSKDIYNPIYGEPNSCCTQTYLVIGPFTNKEQCENVMSYIKTKFFRFITSLKKNAQHSNRRVYQFVPQQDFSKPWTDEELYKKYKLTEEEITYIETMVRPME